MTFKKTKSQGDKVLNGSRGRGLGLQDSLFPGMDCTTRGGREGDRAMVDWSVCLTTFSIPKSNSHARGPKPGTWL